MQQTMIVSSSHQVVSDGDEQPIVVTTPLEAIVRLERRQIRTVVLTGAHASNHELAAFLGECYPSIQVEREH